MTSLRGAYQYAVRPLLGCRILFAGNAMKRKFGVVVAVLLWSTMSLAQDTPKAELSNGRITLTLVLPGKFGSTVAFVPRLQINHLPESNEIADDLRSRAYWARSGHAG